MPVGVITTFLQLSGINLVGAEGGTFRSYFRYISLTVSSASLSCIAVGAALNCNADSIRGAYLRSVLYFSVIRCNGSKLSLRDRSRVSSTLLINSCQGRTSSIAAQGSSPDSLALSNACPTGNVLLQLTLNQLSRLLESFGLRAFCPAEQTAQNTLVQINNFVSQRSNDTDD